MKKLKDSYDIRLRCATCGCEDQFEYNNDKSYIKCTFCNKEYFGGIEELKELSQDAFDEVKEKMQKDAASYIKDQFKKAFRGNKHIKIK